MGTLSNVKLEGGYWFIENTTSVEDLVSFTETKGVYSAKYGKDIVIVNKSTGEKQYYENGLIELPEGNYSVAVKADANGDGNVDIKDLIRLKKSAAGLDGMIKCMAACDFNGDGIISATDISEQVNILLNN